MWALSFGELIELLYVDLYLMKNHFIFYICIFKFLKFLFFKVNFVCLGVCVVRCHARCQNIKERRILMKQKEQDWNIVIC
jgi:hypothetical protein